MKRNLVKEKLKAGQLTFGGWITIPHPALAEVMALSGFEFLVIDVEHGAISAESVQTLIQAMAATEVVPLVRLAGSQRMFVNQILDTGPGGVIIPMVNSREAAEEAVRAVRYPPEGARGIGLGRAQGYNDGQRKDYLKVANELMLAAVQIEHRDAVAHVEEIVTLPGIDLIFIGPSDLSASMGHRDQPGHPEVTKAIEKVVRIARRAQVPLGIPIGTPEEVAVRVRQGFQFLHLGLDSVYLMEACRESCRAAQATAAKALEAVSKP